MRYNLCWLQHHFQKDSFTVSFLDYSITLNAVADPGFPRRGSQSCLLRGGGTNLLFGHFFRKLPENEEFLVERGAARPQRPLIRHCNDYGFFLKFFVSIYVLHNSRSYKLNFKEIFYRICMLILPWHKCHHLMNRVQRTLKFLCGISRIQ